MPGATEGRFVGRAGSDDGDGAPRTSVGPLVLDEVLLVETRRNTCGGGRLPLG